VQSFEAGSESRILEAMGKPAPEKENIERYRESKVERQDA